MAIKPKDKNFGSSRNINYVGKDFATLKENLIEYTKTYFPNTYSDFNEGVVGFGLELFNVIAPLLTSLTISSLTCCLTSFLTTSLMRPNNTSDFDIIDTFLINIEIENLI